MGSDRARSWHQTLSPGRNRRGRTALRRSRMESACLPHRRNLSQLEPINPDACACEFFLESRHGKIALPAELHKSKETRFLSQSRDACEIIKVIGRDPQNSVLFQRRPDRSQETRRHHPAAMMPSLRPGIGKEEMKRFYRSLGQQILDGIRGFEMQHAHIVNPGRFATDFFDATGEALDSKKVLLPHPRGQRKKKCTPAAAKIDMERCNAPENFLRIETGGTRFWNQLDHRDRSPRQAGVSTLPAEVRRAEKSHKSAPALSKIDNMKRTLLAFILGALLALFVDFGSAQKPSPASTKTAVFAGGCFWCIQPAFDKANGVVKTVLGYCGGTEPNPTDGQFTDIGPSYRAAIFYGDNEEKKIAEASKEKLAHSRKFDKPIATEILPLLKFYPAEAYHQKYYQQNTEHFEAFEKASGRVFFQEKTWSKSP